MTDFPDRERLVRTVTAWNAEDWEDRLRSVWDPQGVIVSPEGWPESGIFEGWDAMVEQWGRIKDSWVEEHVEVVSVEPAGDGALAELVWVVRGEASGAPLEVRVWLVCEFGQGRLTRMVYFLDDGAARSGRAVQLIRR